MASAGKPEGREMSGDVRAVAEAPRSGGVDDGKSGGDGRSPPPSSPPHLPMKRTRELQAQFAKEQEQQREGGGPGDPPAGAAAAESEGGDEEVEGRAEGGGAPPPQPEAGADGDEEACEPPSKKANVGSGVDGAIKQEEEDAKGVVPALDHSGPSKQGKPTETQAPSAQTPQEVRRPAGQVQPVQRPSVLLPRLPEVPPLPSQPAMVIEQQVNRGDLGASTLSTVSCTGQELSLDLLSSKGGRRGRGTRRGPMDEMRQLVRILVKIIPQSFPFLASTEDGGGNRISEEQIKFYLDKTLGTAPRPEWGLPKGWGHYVAGLFEWATGRTFTEEQARECAKRLPGRSWEAVETVLEEFKLRPNTWKLPLQRGEEAVDGLYLLTDENNLNKSAADGEELRRPRKTRSHAPNLSKVEGLPEVDVWKLVHQLLKVAMSKQGTTGADMRDTLHGVIREVKEMTEQCLRTSEPPATSQCTSVPPATHLQPGTGALASMSLQSLQALQQLQQQHQPTAVAVQAGTASQGQTMAYPAMAVAAAGIDGVHGVVHRPVARSSGAFTPVVPAVVMQQPSTMVATPGTGDPATGKAASDTVSEHEENEAKGEIVDQQQGDGQKQVMPDNSTVKMFATHQHAGVAQGVAQLTSDNSQDSEVIATGQAVHVTGASYPEAATGQPAAEHHQLMQAAGMSHQHAAEAAQLVSLSQHIHAAVPSPQQLQYQTGAFGGFPTFSGLTYSAGAKGGVPMAVPVQLPTGQIVYGQAADMSQFQMQAPMAAAQQVPAAGQQSAQMTQMLTPQPIVLTLQPSLGYASPQMGGMMATGHTAQGVPHLAMAVPGVSTLQPGAMQHVQGM